MAQQMDQVFQCVLHHAGDISCFNDPEYVGPEEILDCDPDFFSYFALLATLKYLGYVSLTSLWYFDPVLEDGMVRLNSDIGCRRMQNIAYQFDKVHLYAIHPLSQPEIVAPNPLIEYPIMAPHVPPVRNEINEGANSVGPTAEGEGANVDGGVRGVGPTAECTNVDGPELDYWQGEKEEGRSFFSKVEQDWQGEKEEGKTQEKTTWTRSCV
jgi:hypothetical protein